MTGLAGPAAIGLHAENGERVRARTAPEWALRYLYLFRRVVVTLALVGAGAAWATDLPWLAAAGLAIATGEWLESSYYIGVLRWGQRRGMLPTTSRRAG